MTSGCDSSAIKLITNDRISLTGTPFPVAFCLVLLFYYLLTKLLILHLLPGSL